MKYKICIYAICKDEEKFVDRFMDIVKDADMVLIGDTGSSDKSKEKFRARGALVYDIPTKPWRFDKARNDLLNYIPYDVDICFSLDVDEVLNEGWRKCIEDAWIPSTTIARYLYIWSFNADGTPGVMYNHHRMHSRNGYRWIYPTHEVLDYIGGGKEESVFISGLKVNHYPDSSKDRSFNLELLELALKENPDDCRNTHYLGREYMFAGKYEDSINTLKKYLSLPNSNWNEERSASMRYIGNCYNYLGNYTEAKCWMLRAISETPLIRDPYIALAAICYEKEDWNIVHFAITEALKIEHNNVGGYPTDPRAWNYYIYDIGSLACYHLGLYKESLALIEKAVKLAPDDDRLKRNLDFMKTKI